MNRDFYESMLKAGSRTSQTYAAQRKKQQEDEEEKRLQLEAENQAKVNAQKEADASNPFKVVGDVAGAVGNFVKDAAVDIYKTGESSVKGIADVVGGQVAANRLEDNTKIRNDISKEHNANLSKLVDLNNPNDTRWDSKEVKAEIKKYNDAVAALDEQDKGLLGSIDTSRKVDTKKVAADTAETFLNVASGGTGAGVKSGIKQGIKTVVRNGATKQGAKEVTGAVVRGAGEGAVFGGASGLTDSISEGMNPEEAAANVAQNAGFGAILGGASAGVGKGLKVRKDNKALAAEQNRQAIENADVAQIDTGVDDIATQLTNDAAQADARARGIGSAAVGAQDAQVKLDTERPFNAITDEELDAQLAAFNEGGNRTGDIRQDYARNQELLNEKQFRQTEAERKAFMENGLPNDVAGAQAALDDFNSGASRPDSVYTTAQPITRAAEVLAREDMPVELKNAAEEVVSDRNIVETQLASLMSPETKNAQIQQLDNQYNEALQALTQRFTRVNDSARTGGNLSVPTQDPNFPGQSIGEVNPIADYTRDPRFIREKQILDDQYQESMSELDMLEAQDAQQVQVYQDMLQKLDQRDTQITNDVNQLMESAPTEFRDIDPQEFAAQKQALQDNLDQAGRFGNAERVVEQVSTSPNPIATYNKSAEAQDAFKNEVSHQVDEIPETNVVAENFKSLSDVKMSTLRVMSPSQVLERWGLRNEAIDLHTGILRAESAVNAANKADSEVLTRIAQGLPNNKEAQRQIVEYLEGSRKTLSAFDQESATAIRQFLDEKRAGLENLGFKTLDDYFPHVFDAKDPEVQRIFNSKATGEVSFGNLKQRLSESDDYSRDIMNVLAQYASGYNRKVHLEPALKPLADLPTQVKMADAESRWIDDYVKQLMGWDQSGAGKGFNSFMDGVLKKVGLESQAGKNHYSSVLGTQRMVSAVATMGLNPGTAIRNLTQGINTIANIGPRYSTIGAIDGLRALRAGPGSKEWAELQRVGVMEGGVSQNYFDAITKPGVQGRISRGVDTTTKVLMSLIRGTDITLRAQAYYGAKALAAKKGLAGQAAEDFAARRVIDTQFITSRVDMPLAFNGNGVRSLTQLATFSGKQAGFLKRTLVGEEGIIQGKDGKYRLSPKAAGSVLAAVTTAALATEALKPTIGFRETEWIPFYDQIAPFFGDDSGDSLYRSPLVRLLAGDGKSKIGLIDAIQDNKMEKFWGDNWSQIIPMGTQIKKTTEGLATTLSGVSRNSQGNIRYLQDMDFDNTLKASLFGQYSTDAGRNWIDQGFPTLTEKQTAEVNAQATREKQQQYVDYYQALKNVNYKTPDGETGRNAAYGLVREAAERGDVNAAVRIAQDYNAAVNAALEQYWSSNTDMPQALRDNLTSKVLINASKIDTNP